MKNRLLKGFKSLMIAYSIVIGMGLLFLSMYYLSLSENTNINLDNNKLIYSKEYTSKFKINRIDFSKYAYSVECENIENKLMCEMDKVKYVFNIENLNYKKDVSINGYNLGLILYVKDNSIVELFTNINKYEYIYDMFLNFIMVIGVFMILATYFVSDSFKIIKLNKEVINEKEKSITNKYARLTSIVMLIIIVVPMILIMIYSCLKDNSFGLKNEKFYVENIKTNKISADGEFIIFNNISRVSYNEVFELDKSYILNNGVESLKFNIDDNMETNNQYKCKYDKEFICYNNGDKYIINVFNKNIMTGKYSFNEIVNYMKEINNEDFKFKNGKRNLIIAFCIYGVFIFLILILITLKKDKELKKLNNRNLKP